MIRIWLWEEAPIELRDYPTLPGLVAGTVPIWLAHVPAGEGDEADVFHLLCTSWARRSQGELHSVGMGSAGVLLAGCLVDRTARKEASGG